MFLKETGGLKLLCNVGTCSDQQIMSKHDFVEAYKQYRQIKRARISKLKMDLSAVRERGMRRTANHINAPIKGLKCHKKL